MNDYNVKVTVKHDLGKINLTFSIAYAADYSDAAKRAIEMVLKAENCPKSAIKKLEITVKD